MVSSKYLKIIAVQYRPYCTAGSLNSKHNEFLVAMERYCSDILAINETWVQKGQEDCAPVMLGYRFIHVPRTLRTRAAGVGVAFYIKHDHSARKWTLHLPATNVEQLGISVTINGRRILIGTAYRPHWACVDKLLDALTDSITSFSNFDSIVLVGNVNINILEYDSGNAKRLHLFFDYTNFTNFVTLPTHFTCHSETLIDLHILF